MKKYLTLLGGLLGNALEHYDKSLFAFLSPFLAPQIFPNIKPVLALLYTFSLIPMGMLARPLGALVFGYIGDKYGARNALCISLVGMGIVSFILAVCPTYDSVGWTVALIFLISRFLQNFFAAGETMGGAQYLLSKTENDKQNLVSSLFSSSTIAGILLASFGITLCNFFSTVELLWRWLYLFGSITAVLGLMLRLLDPKNDSGQRNQTAEKKTCPNF